MSDLDDMFRDISVYFEEQGDTKLFDLWGMLFNLRYIDDDDLELLVFDSFDRAGKRFRIFPPFFNKRQYPDFAPTFVWEQGSIYYHSDRDPQALGERISTKIDGLWVSLAAAQSLELSPIEYGGWLDRLLFRRIGPPGVTVAPFVDYDTERVTLVYTLEEKETSITFDMALGRRPLVQDAAEQLVAHLEDTFGDATTWFS